MSDATRINSAATVLLSRHGAEYTAGFLVSQLTAALESMPKTKRAMFMAQFEAVVGSVVKIKVRNIMNPEAGEIEIPWDQVGGPCDPSTERYHSM